MTNHLSAVLVALAAVLVLAACGSGSSTTTVTAGASSSTLSQRSWTNYQAALANAKSENTKATGQFGYCTTLGVGTTQSKTLQESCFASSTAGVLLTGGEATGMLQALMNETTGACHDALSTLNDQVNAYIESVQAIDTTVKAGKVPTTQEIDTAKNDLKALQTSSAKTDIESSCKPSS